MKNATRFSAWNPAVNEIQQENVPSDKPVNREINNKIISFESVQFAASKAAFVFVQGVWYCISMIHYLPFYIQLKCKTIRFAIKPATGDRCR